MNRTVKRGEARPEFEEISSAFYLMRFPGVGAKAFKQLIATFKTPSAALHATKNGNADTIVKSFAQSKRKTQNTELIERALDYLRRMPHDEGVTYYGAIDYPERLKAMSEPPPVLFYKGEIEVLSQARTVAIVGARKASNEGLRLSGAIAKRCAERNVVTVSGGAMGIDAEAHRSTLAAGGLTICVIATGIDICYPPVCKDLFLSVPENGIIVTEFFPSTPPVAIYFPTRNRIIAALSDAVVFVEGSAKSGGLITVKKALSMDKPVFYFLNDKLIVSGARWLKEYYPQILSAEDSTGMWELTKAVYK